MKDFFKTIGWYIMEGVYIVGDFIFLMIATGLFMGPVTEEKKEKKV